MIATKNLNDFVKTKRSQQGWTQKDLAERANVDLQVIRDLEQGNENLHLDQVNQVLAVYGHHMRPEKIESRSSQSQNETELYREQNRKFLAAEKELTDFTYSVSHDLRAPLRRLDGFSSALLQDKYTEKLDEQGVHYLERIRHAANDMGNLIDNLLKLSRLNKQKITLEIVDVSDLARTIIDSITDEETRKSIRFDIEDEISIKADSGLLRVLLQNLLENAIKYSSKESAPEIQVFTESIDNKWVISVRDNGVGFDNRHSDKLFRAFQRLHSDFDFEGNGIGLATAKRIVNMHGGEIWAESEIGKGAKFSFYL